MSKYNHFFNTQDAKEHGVIEAIILAHMKFWLDKNASEGTNVKEGRVWTFNSYKAFASHFDYLTEKQVRRAISKLEESGVLISGSFNRWPGDRTKWYTIDAPNYIIQDQHQEDQAIGRNGQMDQTEWADQLPKRAEPIAQMGRPIPDINTDSKQQIVNTYIDTADLDKLDDLEFVRGWSASRQAMFFVELWNRLYNARIKYTPRKDKEVARKTKDYTIAEIVQALQARKQSKWHADKGILGVWSTFWEHGDKVEEFLNKDQFAGAGNLLGYSSQDEDLPF